MITYDKNPLLLPDPESDLGRFLARYQPLEGLRLFGDLPIAVKSSRTASRYDNDAAIGLPIANYPPMPTLKLNTLYWPTGATRWAYGVFLCDGRTLADIQEAAGKDSKANALKLKWGDKDQQQLETSMFLLPPRKVSCDADTVDTDLWLLPLVDERYWWQFLNIGDIDAVGNEYAWSDLFDAIDSAGITHTPGTIPGSYLVPDPIEFDRWHDNLAVLFEAAAFSVGHRVVRSLDGTVKTMTASDANDQQIDSLSSNPGDPIAGGDWSDLHGDAPEKVKVVFRRSRDHHVFSGGTRHSILKDAPASVKQKRIAAEKVIHCAALGDQTGISNTADPQNNSSLDALAGKIRDDYYAWLALRFDYTFQGVKEWFPCGAEHYVEWAFGRQADGSYEAHTRIVSLPSDFGIDVQLSQDSSLMPMFGDIVLAKTDLSHAKSANGTCSVYSGTPGSETDTTENITAYNKYAALGSGKWVDAGWDPQSNYWYLLAGEC